MSVRRWLSVLGCLVVLSVAAPLVGAAPAPQQPRPAADWDVMLSAPGPLASPALQAAVVEGVERIFPADVVEQWPIRFVPYQRNAYLVSHPALYWRVQDEPAARAMAEVLAELTPGWSTSIFDGPYGRGVYLTYQHDS